MPTVVLMRHAAAMPGTPDIERVLDPRGRQQAAYQGVALARAVGKIDYAIVSDAVRTRMTFAGLTSGGLTVADHRFEHSLYSQGWENVMNLVRETPQCETLLVLGHEPTMTLAAHWLASDPTPVRFGFSTAMAVVNEIDAWAELEPGQLTIREVLRAAV